MSHSELMQWYNEMGVDTTVEAEPQDRTKPAAPSPKKAEHIATSNPITHPQPIMPPTPSTMSPHDAINQARNLADTAKNLEELKTAVEQFDACALKKTATNTVFSDGNPESNIMFIGEAPGANEDMEGIPFCGVSGQLLDKMLACINISRKENCYITNTLFWRPPGNRRPTPEEIAICRPFVERHIALFQPKIIILVGGTAITSVLNSNIGITKMRAKFYDYSNQYLKSPIKTTAMFHPSYLLRSPGQKRLAWQDLLKIQKFLQE